MSHAEIEEHEPLHIGQRVRVEFPCMTFEGLVASDCEAWGTMPLFIRESKGGPLLRLNTWLADSVEILPESEA